jgi:hypothetical protein
MKAANADAKPEIAGNLSVSLVRFPDLFSSTRSHHSAKMFMGSSTQASGIRRDATESLALMRYAGTTSAIEFHLARSTIKRISPNKHPGLCILAQLLIAVKLLNTRASRCPKRTIQLKRPQIHLMLRDSAGTSLSH